MVYICVVCKENRKYIYKIKQTENLNDKNLMFQLHALSEMVNLLKSPPNFEPH